MRGTRGRFRLIRVLGATMACALVVAACGGGTTGSTTTTTEGTAAPTTTTTGGTDTTTPAEPTGPEGTLRYIVSSPPLTLDAMAMSDRRAQQISRMIHDNLTTINPETMEDLPKLATSWEQIDERTWEIKLVEGVEFHNGEPLNCDAVKFTFDRVLDPELATNRAVSMGPFDSIEVVDDYTCLIHMSDEYPGFGAPTGFTYTFEIVAPGHMSEHTFEEVAVNPVGTGPFKFVEYVPEQHLILEANEDYWDGVSNVKEVVIRFITEEATAVAELEAGNADIIDTVSVDTALRFLDNPDFNVVTTRGTTMWHLEARVTGGPFASTEARIGLNHAIDREPIIENLYGGLAEPVYAIAFPGQEGFEADFIPYPYDPERARELLADVTETIDLYHPAAVATVAEAIAQQLRDVGLDVQTIPLDTAAATAMRASGDFDLRLTSSASATFSFNRTWWQNRFSCEARTRDSGAMIASGWCNPEIDAMFDEGAELDRPERDVAMRPVVRAVMEDPPWVGLWAPNPLYLTSSRVCDFVPWPSTQTNLHEVRIDGDC